MLQYFLEYRVIIYHFRNPRDSRFFIPYIFLDSPINRQRNLCPLGKRPRDIVNHTLLYYSSIILHEYGTPFTLAARQVRYGSFPIPTYQVLVLPYQYVVQGWVLFWHLARIGAHVNLQSAHKFLLKHHFLQRSPPNQPTDHGICDIVSTNRP
jgi:hypothetical protein